MLGTDGEQTRKPRAQGERWTTDQVLAVAPDAASRKAGGKLATPGPWSGTGAGDGAVWGVCKGSGTASYRTMIDTTGPAFKCGCPSRKFPCKHALGLLLLWAGEDGSEGDTEAVVSAGEPPQWVAEWLSGRREHREGRPGKGDKDGGKDDKGGKGLADPAAARRRAERRAQRIGAGAEELERRLADLLRSGLAAADRAGYGSWDETAARMVDAQAPGLAARVRELASIPGSGADWPSRLLEECALLHLLDEGFLGIERLPEPLAATVRSRVGLPADHSGAAEVSGTAEVSGAAEVSSAGAVDVSGAAEGAPDGPVDGSRERTVRDRWLVLAQQDREEGPQGKLTTRRIWMRGERTGRMAQHLSFAGPGRTHELALPPGLVLDADLTYHPGARPLRVTLGERYAPAAPGGVPTGCGTDAALAAYGDVLRDDPWLDSWPVVLADVVPIPARPPAPGRPASGWQLADVDGESALPVDPRRAGEAGLWQLVAISGGGPVTVFGECGHRGFVPLTTWDPAPVAL
ncbi:SWIM zinc finger family protein [Streptomyces niger]|uniref:SWIM zinc finger family protein n=1 Tax=Streptomyces niger TaxID=66373 RepID=UPI00069A33EE|nr:SWIM zinc finger family protein [Streptomyces niger]